MSITHAPSRNPGGVDLSASDLQADEDRALLAYLEAGVIAGAFHDEFLNATDAYASRVLDAAHQRAASRETAAFAAWTAARRARAEALGLHPSELGE